MMWLITAMSLVGVVLNIYKRQECFMIWIVTNAAWSAYDLAIGAHEQALLFAVYFVLAAWGLIKWRKQPAAQSPTGKELRDIPYPESSTMTFRIWDSENLYNEYMNRKRGNNNE